MQKIRAEMGRYVTAALLWSAWNHTRTSFILGCLDGRQWSRPQKMCLDDRILSSDYLRTYAIAISRVACFFWLKMLHKLFVSKSYQNRALPRLHCWIWGSNCCTGKRHKGIEKKWREEIWRDGRERTGKSKERMDKILHRYFCLPSFSREKSKCRVWLVVTYLALLTDHKSFDGEV